MYVIAYACVRVCVSCVVLAYLLLYVVFAVPNFDIFCCNYRVISAQDVEQKGYAMP